MTISIELYIYKISVFKQSGQNMFNLSSKSLTIHHMISIRILIVVFLINSSTNLRLRQTKNLSSVENLSNHFNLQELQCFKNQEVSVCTTVPVSTLCWSYCCDINALVHSLYGNRRIGYKIGFWNCRKKLISSNSFDTNKLTDIKAYFGKNQPHVFAIIESDLFGVNSECNRNQKFTTEQVQSKLRIDGYRIVLPKSWYCHGLAKPILFYIFYVIFLYS